MAEGGELFGLIADEVSGVSLGACRSLVLQF